MKCHIYIYQKYLKFKKKRFRRTKFKYSNFLNPKNEEAIYNLAKLKLDLQIIKKVKNLNKRLTKLCNKFCDKSKKLKIEIENLSKK